MLFAPGISCRTFKFGDRTGTIYVSDNSSLDSVTQTVMSTFNQDPSFFMASLVDNVYVISERLRSFPKTHSEWKDEQPNFIYGECPCEVQNRPDILKVCVPQLEFFNQNGKCYFRFPPTFLKAKNTPPLNSKKFKIGKNSFYMDSSGQGGYIPSKLEFIPFEKLENLMKRIPENDLNIAKMFQDAQMCESDGIVDMDEMSFDLYEKITRYLDRGNKKQKIITPELKVLARKTHTNTVNAISELRNELRKSAGKVVSGEFAPPTDNFRSEFSLNPKDIPVEIDEDDSVNSDTVSSED